MANENPSRDSASRQQSAERAQTGSTASQQGAGTTRTGAQGSSYGQGSSMLGTAGQGSHGGGSQGTLQQGRGGGQGSNAAQGTSTGQGGRTGQGQGGALARRGGWGSMSPYGSEYESGYGSGPFSIMRRISDEMDRFFENFGMGRSLMSGGESGQWGEQGYGGRNLPSMWSPHVEVSERDGKLLVQADLPGMKREDINVQIEQDAIVIQGERKAHQTSNQGGYYRSERSYGSFYRTIPLPEGTNADSAQASFRDGVLEIELDAPREQQRGRRLEIREGSGSSGSTGSTQSHAGTSSGATYGGAQQAASGTSGSQHSSGSGTMYSGSGNPSAGAEGGSRESTGHESR
jgi:HSP20 family protein